MFNGGIRVRIHIAKILEILIVSILTDNKKLNSKNFDNLHSLES